MLREIISKGADIHSIDSTSCTPLMSLRKVSLDSAENYGIHIQAEAIDTWLSELRECGVDLYEYGRREEEMYRDGSASRTFQIYELSSHSYKMWKLVNFTYGSSRSDWNLQLERVPEECDGQYEQVQEIPGSWVED